MQNNQDYITDTERELMRYIPCLSKSGTVYLLNPFTLKPAKPFLDRLRWQVIGERETPARPEYTPREERTLHDLGNTLRLHPSMTVAECEREYSAAVRDTSLARNIIMKIIERDMQFLHLHRMAQAGAYDVDTGEERILTQALRKDVERRMDYLKARDKQCQFDTDMHYMDADAQENKSVFRDGAFRGLLFALILTGFALVFGALCDALRLL